MSSQYAMAGNSVIRGLWDEPCCSAINGTVLETNNNNNVCILKGRSINYLKQIAETSIGQLPIIINNCPINNNQAQLNGRVVSNALQILAILFNLSSSLQVLS